MRKRVGAFIIDMLIVCLLALTLSNLSYLNPRREAYEKASEEYQEIFYEYQSSILGSGSNRVEDLGEIADYMKTTIMPGLKAVENSSVFYSLWYLIIYFLYFVVFTYFNNGQTLGKKFFKIKVVNKGEDKIYFNRLIRRSLINGTSLYYGINIILLLRLLCTFINNVNVFAYCYFALEFLSIALELSLVLTLFINKGTRLTNDFLANTEVVEVK